MAHLSKLILIPVVLVLSLAAAQPAFAVTASSGQSDITISASAATSNITKSAPASGTVTWTPNADDAVVNIADLAGATGLGTYNVVLDTTNAAGNQTGNISNPAGNPINSGSTTTTLTLKSAGVTTLDSALTTSGDLVLDGTGTAIIDQPLDAHLIWVKRPLSLGASITTSSNQLYNGGPVTLTANATLTSTADSLLIFATVDGAHSLTLSGANITFSEFIGAGTPLTSITVNASFDSALSHTAGATVHTTGDQSYNNLRISNNDQTVRSDSGTISLTGALDVDVHRLILDGKGSIPGAVAGTTEPGGLAGGIDFTGPGPWVVGGANTYPGGTTVTNSILRVNGTIGAVTLNGSTLGGTGTVGDVTGTSSTVSPGSSPGKLTTGNLTLMTTPSVVVELNGTSAGTGYDQIAVNGTVDLGGSTLGLTASTFPHVGSVFRIIDNDGTDPVTGIFWGLPEGSFVDLAGARLRVSYVGGTGNDVTLTPVKQAPTVATSSSPETVVEGNPFDVSATVGGPAGAPAPTGTVTFSEGGTALGTASLSNGVATLHVSSLPAGHHDLTASYSGNGDFEAGSAGLIREIAVKPPSSSAPATEPAPTAPAPGPAVFAPTVAGVTISVAGASGKENDPPRKPKKGAKKAKPKTVVFVVTLSRATASPVTVKYATKGGTAKAGKDLERTAGKLTFKPGVTKLKIAVPIVPDNKKEKLERFTLVLSGPVGATLAKATATGTIKDDD